MDIMERFDSHRFWGRKKRGFWSKKELCESSSLLLCEKETRGGSLQLKTREAIVSLSLSLSFSRFFFSLSLALSTLSLVYFIRLIRERDVQWTLTPSTRAYYITHSYHHHHRHHRRNNGRRRWRRFANEEEDDDDDRVSRARRRGKRTVNFLSFNWKTSLSLSLALSSER